MRSIVVLGAMGMLLLVACESNRSALGSERHEASPAQPSLIQSPERAHDGGMLETPERQRVRVESLEDAGVLQGVDAGMDAGPYLEKSREKAYQSSPADGDDAGKP